MNVALGTENCSDVINQIVEVCSSYSEVQEIILYGSRAKGTALERSDIDVAIVGNHIDIEELRDQVDSIDTLLKIDLVDIKNSKNELLKNEVNKYGIILYRKI